MNERVEIAWHTKDIQERLCNPFFHMNPPLPPPPEYWDDRWVTPAQLQNAFFKTKKKSRKNSTKSKKNNKI